MLPTRSAMILGASFIVGCVALGVILRVSPGGVGSPGREVGRYQISGVKGHMFVLDTATGRIWEKFASESSFSSGGFTRITIPPPNAADPLLHDLSDAPDVERFLEKRKSDEAREKKAP